MHMHTPLYHVKFSISTNSSYPSVNAADGKPPEPEGWAEAAGVLGFAPNVNIPDALLFVKLKFVALLANWKIEPIIVEAEKLH